MCDATRFERRSEAEWFPRFILICKNRLSWMNPEETDYVPMQQITQCYHHVRSIVKEYNEPHFANLIHMHEGLATKAMARENGSKIQYTDNQLNDLDMDNLSKYITYGSLSWVQCPSSSFNHSPGGELGSVSRMSCPLQLMLPLPKFLICSPLTPFPLFFSNSREVDPDSFCLLVPM